MSRVIAIVACGFILAACSSSWMPSFEMPRPASSAATLRLESEPSGAEARLAQGQACQTPCEMTVTLTGDTTVTYTLAGYAPQTVAVELLPPGDARFGEPTEPRLSPNPVFVELEPAPPPPRRPPAKRPPAKKKAAAPPAPPAPAPAASSPFPPPPASSPFPPPPASAFPPPPQR